MIRGSVYGILAASIWGGMYVVSDVVLESIPPFTLQTIRLLIASALLGSMVWWARMSWPSTQSLIRMLAIGMLGSGLSVGASFIGTYYSTAVNASLITSASPAFIVLFAALILREPLTLRRIAAVVVSTVGVAVIVIPASADFSSATWIGDVALVIAAVTWGLYSVFIRQVSFNVDTLSLTLFVLLGGLLITIPASFIEVGLRPVGAVTGNTVLAVLYLSLVSTAATAWLWNRAFALVDASIASLFFFAQPLVGAILSVFILNQQLTWALWIGGVLILSGALIALINPSPSAQTLTME